MSEVKNQGHTMVQVLVAKVSTMMSECWSPSSSFGNRPWQTFCGGNGGSN